MVFSELNSAMVVGRRFLKKKKTVPRFLGFVLSHAFWAFFFVHASDASGPLGGSAGPNLKMEGYLTVPEVEDDAQVHFHPSNRKTVAR